MERGATRTNGSRKSNEGRSSEKAEMGFGREGKERGRGTENLKKEET